MRLAPSKSLLQGQNVHKAYEWETTPMVSFVTWPRWNPANQAGKTPARLCQSTLPYWNARSNIKHCGGPGNPLGQWSCQVLLSSAKPAFERLVGLCTNTNYCWVAQRRVNDGRNCKSRCPGGGGGLVVVSLKKPFKVGPPTSQGDGENNQAQRKVDLNQLASK